MSIRRRLQKLFAVSITINIDRSWAKQNDLLVTVTINPSRNDLARLLQANQEEGLRVLDNNQDFVVWPAGDAIHYQVAVAMPQMNFISPRYGWSIDLNIRNKHSQFKVGRFNVDVWHDEGAGKVSPERMSKNMQRALGPLLTEEY
jgi:hypothetical protein